MALEVVPFAAEHYDVLRASNPVADGGQFVASPTMLAQIERQNSWTGMVDGVPLVSAGTIQVWPGRHTAWAYLGKNTGPHMVWITRQVKKQLAMVVGRIELTVRSDFPMGQRWAEMLGFHVETPCLVAYGPSQEDHVGFVRFS